MTTPRSAAPGGDSQSLEDLFASAVTSGVLSADTSSLITGDLGTLVVAGAAGKDLEELDATDVTLVTVLLDRSSSIAYGGLEKAVREGYNLLADTFSQANEADGLLMALWTFNHEAHVVHSYVPVEDATRLTAKNFSGGGGTALYDTWCDGLAANVAYAQQLRAGGTPCRSVAVVITDGEDCNSRRTAADCKRLARDLLASEQFVLAFVGVGDETSFRAIASQMGIPDDAVAVAAQADAGQLRRVFEMVSQSALRFTRAAGGASARRGFF